MSDYLHSVVMFLNVMPVSSDHIPLTDEPTNRTRRSCSTSCADGDALIEEVGKKQEVKSFPVCQGVSVSVST